MKRKHPFLWLPVPFQGLTFIILALLTLLVMASLQVLGRPLITEAAPAGIVSFEFSGSLEVAQQVVDSWGAAGKVYAGLNLGLDYLFLVFYGLAISLGCVIVAQEFSNRSIFTSIVGVILAWGQLAASALDAVENYALIQILLGSNRAIWSSVAFWCARPKFIIVALGLVYIIACGLISAILSKKAS